jgi:hypothetical protein
MRERRRIEIRVSEDVFEELRKAASRRGFASVNKLLRAAVAAELRHGESALARTEQNIAASIELLAKEVRGIHRAHQATFALTDSLARLVLTCVPEPPAEILEQARLRAKLRYDRFVRSVAQNMAREARAAIAELVGRD